MLKLRLNATTLLNSTIPSITSMLLYSLMGGDELHWSLGL
jgi:hypothetical protein